MLSPTRVRLAAAVLAALVPLVVLAVVARPYAMPYFLGMLPTMTAAFASVRRAWVVAGMTGLLAVVAPVAGAHVGTATVLMSLVAAALGLSALRAWTSGGAPAAATLAALTVAPPTLTEAGPRTLEGAWPVGATVLAAGLWTAAAATLWTRSMPRRVQEPLRGAEGAYYTTALVVFTAVATWWATTWFPDTHAWWLLLTFYMVMVPRAGAVTARAAGRAGGTVLGAATIVLLVELDLPSAVMTAVLVAGVVGCVVAYAVAPYWVYAAFLTMTVLGVSTGADPVAGAETRVALTLLGAGCAVAVLWFARGVRDAVERRE